MKISFPVRTVASNILAYILAASVGCLAVLAIILYQGFSPGEPQVAPFLRGLLASLILSVIGAPSGFWVRVVSLSAVYFTDLAVSGAANLLWPTFTVEHYTNISIANQQLYISAAAFAVSSIVGYTALGRYGESPKRTLTPGIQSALPVLAGPWPRLLARFIDLALFGLLVTFSLGYLGSWLAPEIFIAMTTTYGSFLNIVTVQMAVLLSACIMAITGSTPGKAILSITVKPLSENTASFYLGREFRFWVAGLGFGIPMIALFTLMRQYRFVAAGQSATYDLGRASVEGRASSIRVAAGCLIAVLLACVSIYLSLAGQLSDRSLRHVKPWKNPLTNKTAYIAQTWQYSELPVSSGRAFYFKSDDLLADAVLGYETSDIENPDSLSYAHTLADALNAKVRFTSLWAPVTIRGHAALRATGESLMQTGTQVEITIEIKGRNAWRTLLFTRGRTAEQVPNKEFFIGEVLGTAN